VNDVEFLHGCSAAGATWFAQLRLLLEIRDNSGAPSQLAVVKWYVEAARSGPLWTQRLRWAQLTMRGGSRQPHYDVIDVARVKRPVLLQHTGGQGEAATFFYNHFVQ
jgi:hypothetical protein